MRVWNSGGGEDDGVDLKGASSTGRRERLEARSASHVPAARAEQLVADRIAAVGTGSERGLRASARGHARRGRTRRSGGIRRRRGARARLDGIQQGLHAGARGRGPLRQRVPHPVRKHLETHELRRFLGFAGDGRARGGRRRLGFLAGARRRNGVGRRRRDRDVTQWRSIRTLRADLRLAPFVAHARAIAAACRLGRLATTRQTRRRRDGRGRERRRGPRRGLGQASLRVVRATRRLRRRLRPVVLVLEHVEGQLDDVLREVHVVAVQLRVTLQDLLDLGSRELALPGL